MSDTSFTPEQDTAQLVANLRDAAIARGEADVQLLHTHISWVLLAGDMAYKFKKPLNLGFLDFSSLVQRHAACMEELRINRRSAPALYLDVLPITGSVQEPCIGGEGAPLDWVVCMRRFPAQALMADMAARGHLRPAHIDALVRAIATFQAQADVAAVDSPWGHAADLARLAQDNLDSLLATQRTPDERKQLQQLEQWTHAQTARLAPLMAQRRAAGDTRHVGDHRREREQPAPRTEQ